MNANWFDRACEQLEQDYAAGLIDFGQYHNVMRNLRDELRGQAEEAAEHAFHDAMGGY